MRSGRNQGVLRAFEHLDDLDDAIEELKSLKKMVQARFKAAGYSTQNLKAARERLDASVEARIRQDGKIASLYEQIGMPLAGGTELAEAIIEAANRDEQE